MRKLVIVISFLSLSISMVFAQQNVHLSGKVIDAQTGDPIPYVQILLTKGGDLIEGGASNINGRFNLREIAQPGVYDVELRMIGYEDKRFENMDLSSSVNLKTVELLTKNVDLSEITVTETVKSASTSIDQRRYRADDFTTSEGGTAVDVLNKLPSVSVDPNGVVSVRGTNDFMVYLNGKPTQLEPSVLLGQIASNSIQSIDVISIPTAKYDAQGKGGIININTKTSGANGLSVTANGLLGGGPWNNLTDTYSNYLNNDNRYGGGVNLLFVKDKLSLYGGLSISDRNVNGMRSGDARLLQSDGSYYHMVAAGERPEWYRSFSANTGFNVKLSEQSNLSGSYFYGNRNDGRSAFYVYHNFFADENKNNPVMEDWVYNPNTDNRYGIFHTANIDYSVELDGASLGFSVLYEHSNLSRELDNFDYDYNPATDATGAELLHFNQTDETPLDGIRLSFDYEKPLDNGNTFSFGIQPQLLNIAGSFGFDTLNQVTGALTPYTDLENAVDLNRNIYAAFIDYRGQKGKLDYVLGLRLEYADRTMTIENPDYFNIFERETKSSYDVQKLDWFPTLHLQYNATSNDQFLLAASRRISRPPVKNMAPFLYRRHYEVFVVGDPLLEPEYMTNFELSYERKLGKHNVNLTGFYRGVTNEVFRVNTVYEEENVLIRSYTNSGNSRALGAELNANFVAGKWAKFFMGGSLYNYHISGDIFGFQEDNNSTNWSLKGNANLSISKSLTFTADLNVKSATVTAQGRNELFYMANAALNYAPKSLRGWDFTVKLLDVLGSNVTGLSTRAFDASGTQIFFQSTEYLRKAHIVELSASYSFNSKAKAKKSSSSTFGKEQF